MKNASTRSRWWWVSKLGLIGWLGGSGWLATLVSGAPLIANEGLNSGAPPRREIQVEVSLPQANATMTGRLFLFVAGTNQAEPRYHAASRFGQDVRGGVSGQRVLLDSGVRGFPEAQLGDLPPGDYSMQALFNVYTEFHRADGHTLWAHMDQWDGQDMARSPGNFYSRSVAVHVGGADPVRVQLELDRVIAPIVVPADTEWVQRVKFESPLLSKFWGRPIYIGATALLPRDYARQPGRRYPVIYIQGHFGLGAPFGFSPEAEPGETKSWARRCEEAAAEHRPPPTPPAGTKGIGSLSNVETGHEFYEAWTRDDFPRVIAVTFQHPTPYFDDSYGVNSPNCGPYGDALTEELIPALERRYRMIQEGYARVLTGTSTGGWGALAMQLYHPDFFGGAWAFSPDPVDFRLYYGGVNLYEDDNAFVEKPGAGFKGGGSMNRRRSREAAILGTQDGSFEWWKHTPFGADGYPLPVWDLATGKIDRAVVEAMRANDFDLREFLSRKWPAIGPKLVGKLHVCAAETDGFYSNLAVRLLDQFMQSTTNPHDPGWFQYGPEGSHHGWQPMSKAALVREIAEHIAARKAKEK